MKKEPKRTMFEFYVFDATGLSSEECAIAMSLEVGDGWDFVCVVPPSGTDPARVLFRREKFDEGK